MEDREKLLAWRRGQNLAARVIREEERARSAGERVEHLESLRRTALSLGWQISDPAEDAAVRDRFQRLRALIGGR